MAVAWSKLKPFSVRVVWITTIADNEVTVAAVHKYRIEAQDTTVARSANHSLLNRATAVSEKAIDNFHLRGKPLWIDDEIRLSTVVINGELPGNAGSL